MTVDWDALAKTERAKSLGDAQRDLAGATLLYDEMADLLLDGRLSDSDWKLIKAAQRVFAEWMVERRRRVEYLQEPEP